MKDISQGEKTQKATHKKRRDEKKKGHIFQSKDITSAVSLLGLFIFLKIISKYYYGFLTNFFSKYFSVFSQVDGLTLVTARNYMTDVFLKMLVLILPVLLIATVLSVSLNAAQTRMNFSTSILKPDFSKINPINGLKKLITLRSLMELFKSAIKIAIVSAVLYSEIKANLNGFIMLFDKSIIQSFSWICNMTFRIIVKGGIFLLLFGILDYFYEWWDYERQIMMSHQEIKDEYKQTEGDPQIKGRQKERQRKMSMLRIAQKVPHADVVIKNPTHFAVAINMTARKIVRLG